VSVNLSGRQFSQSDLVAQIDQILQETKLDGRALKLEITETVIMANPELAASMLLQLKRRNIQLCIDDFGTGYSSLSYLHRFPLDTLKIDQSFVRQMEVEAEHTEIVQTIVTLAHNLGMEVIAEGIETQTQLEKLQGFNCELGQGYLFSKPVDSRTATQFIAQDWNLSYLAMGSGE
jgi:EAL domain-containing protein (putative c-di-GMP-specific phosphodiesterase class I)